MKIAIFHELPYGGARRAVLEFGKILEKDNKVDLYYLDEKREGKVEKIFSKVYFTKFVPKIWHGNDWKSKLYKDTIELYKLYKIHKKIAKIIDKQNYDFVFVHGSKYTQAPFILRFLKTKSAYYSQEPLRMVYEDLFKIPDDLNYFKKIYERINRKIRKTIDSRNIKSADTLLSNSEFTKINIKFAYGIDAIVSYMGVDTKRFYPDKVKKKFDILFIGSMDDIDGYSFLKTALKKMKAKPSVRWVLRENEWISDDSIMRRLYSESKILTCLAYKEPFGLLPIEAQACGTVVIAVNEGGYLETVNNNIGELVKRNPNDLAKALTNLLKDKKRIEKLSVNSVENINQNWTWKVNTNRLLKVVMSK